MSGRAKHQRQRRLKRKAKGRQKPQPRPQSTQILLPRSFEKREAIVKVQQP